jgi:hypothetical protein
MSDIERIVELLRQVHEGEAWHGPSVREAVLGVTAAQAAARPVAAGHTIWELVHHVRAVDAAMCGRLGGRTEPDLSDWPTDAPSEAGWRRALAALVASQKELREAVSRFPERRLHENVPGQAHSYWYELIGIQHHDLYHAGQIALLKKAVGCL